MLTPQPKLLNLTDDNRHFLRAFIHTYRDLPILWDTSLRDYTNRDKRAEAYEQLVPIYRYLKRDATVEDVKKKINTLRTNYRKELKVVECARRSGSVYHPRCWTFHELDFLRNSEKFLAVHPNVKGGDTSFSFNDSSQTASSFMEAPSFNFRSMIGNSNGQQAPPNVTEMFQKSFGTVQKLDQQQQQQSSTHTATPPPSVPSSVAAHTALPNVQVDYAHTSQQQQHDLSAANTLKRQRMSTANQTPNGHHSDELLGMACDYLSSTFPEEESIVRTWTHKLKRMQREQRLLAEKFINEIIFEGELNTLHRGSVQINAFEPYVRFEEQTSEEHQKSQSPSTTTAMANESADTKDVPVHENNVGNENFSNYNH